MLNDLEDTVLQMGIFSDMIITDQDSIKNIGLPKKVILEADNFTGRLDYQMIKVQ